MMNVMSGTDFFIRIGGSLFWLIDNYFMIKLNYLAISGALWHR